MRLRKMADFAPEQVRRSGGGQRYWKKRWFGAGADALVEIDSHPRSSLKGGKK